MQRQYKYRNTTPSLIAVEVLELHNRTWISRGVQWQVFINASDDTYTLTNTLKGDAGTYNSMQDCINIIEGIY